MTSDVVLTLLTEVYTFFWKEAAGCEPELVMLAALPCFQTLNSFFLSTFTIITISRRKN
jgi:hypothetical protein